MPSAEHFADLVDSSLNTLEEGFDKTPEQGFKISSLDEQASLISFYRNSEPDTRLWSASYDGGTDSLLFNRHLSLVNPLSPVNPDKLTTAFSAVDGVSASSDAGQNESGQNTAGPNKAGQHESSKEASKEGQAVLSLTQQGYVGIGQRTPEQMLDVAGVIRSHGREGTQQGQTLSVPADGRWHTISPRLEGCQALEVVAGVGIRRTGRYALIRAVAMNTCAPEGFFFNFLRRKNRIKAQHAYYRSSADKLKLRWVRDRKDPDNSDTYRPYYLQIRSNTRYGEGIAIRYHITRLWHDDYMQNSQMSAEELAGEG